LKAGKKIVRGSQNEELDLKSDNFQLLECRVQGAEQTN
jgi:hypothetical protein